MSTRRRFLAVAGAASVTATAGCMNALGDSGAANDAPGTSGDGDGVRIEGLSVRNNHDESHRVQVAVESADSVVHLNTYQVEPDGETAVEGDWTGTPGEYIIHARLDDGEIQSTDVSGSVAEGTSCVGMMLRIDGEGTLGTLFGTNCDA
jgi:hypothetical protein